MSSFSDMLLYLRKRNHMTQQELADKLNLSRSTISMYELGNNEPSFETLEAIADTFNVNLETLLGKASSSPIPGHGTNTEAVKAAFAQNLSRLINQSNMSQSKLAQAMGVSPSTVSGWCTGDSLPRLEKLEHLARILDVETSELLEDKSLPLINALPFNETNEAPILGAVPAGYPNLAVDNIEGYAPIKCKNPEDYFFLRVVGDSMINAGIRPGDLVLMHHQNYAADGQIVVARVNGEEATLKRFKRQGDNILLLPENSAYEPRVISAQDFEIGYAQILGVALEVRHKLEL